MNGLNNEELTENGNQSTNGLKINSLSNEIVDDPNDESSQETEINGNITHREKSPIKTIFSLPDNPLSRLRHSSGSKTKLESVPEVEKPVTRDNFILFCQYLINNNFSTTDTFKALQNSGIAKDEMVFDDSATTTSTVLIVASKENFPTVVQVLLQLVHSPLTKTSKGYTALHHAIHQNNMDVVKLLMASTEYQHLNLCDKLGNSPAHIAILSQNRDVLKMLRSKGANFSIPNSNLHTPLHLASRMFKLLVENISTEDPLHLDKVLEIENLLNFLLENLTDDELFISLSKDQDNESPLHIFAEVDYHYGIKLICTRIDKSSCFDVVNKYKLTPFLICIEKSFQGFEKKKANL